MKIVDKIEPTVGATLAVTLYDNMGIPNNRAFANRGAIVVGARLIAPLRWVPAPIFQQHHLLKHFTNE